MNWRKMHRNRRKQHCKSPQTLLSELDKALGAVYVEQVRWIMSKDRPYCDGLRNGKTAGRGISAPGNGIVGSRKKKIMHSHRGKKNKIDLESSVVTTEPIYPGPFDNSTAYTYLGSCNSARAGAYDAGRERWQDGRSDHYRLWLEHDNRLVVCKLLILLTRHVYIMLII